MTTRNYLLGALFGFAALLALLCAAACPAHAQNPYVNVTGVLQGPNGLPAANSIISLTPTQQFVVPGTGTTVCTYDYFIQLNATPLAPCDTLDFNSTTPAAPSGYSNVIFQTSKVGTTDFISGYAPTSNGLYCQLVGGSGCVMTGPVEGNASFTDSINGATTGGLSLVDSHGDHISAGNNGSVDFIDFLLPNGAGFWMDNTAPYGRLTFEDSFGNGVVVTGGATFIYGLGVGINLIAGTNPIVVQSPLTLQDALLDSANSPGLAHQVLTATGGGTPQTLWVTPARTCQTGLGDGLNAIPSGTYLQTFCYNDSGSTWTITGIKCFTDNSGSSTLAATDNSANALLTGPITCASTFVGGTQSAHVTIPAGGWVKFSFAADGTSTQSTWVVSLTQ